MERFVVISADCHATGSPDDLGQHMEPRFRQEYEDYRRHADMVIAELARASEEGGRLFSAEAMHEYQEHEAVDATVAGGTPGQWDSARRVKELEDDGVVAEVIFPNGVPFRAAIGGETYSSELQAAGLRCYNRWLADFCAELPDRRAGIALISLHDVAAAVAEVEWAATAGLRGVSVPIVYDDPDAPPLYHDRYEPIWAACEALGLPVHVHGGGGAPNYDTSGLLGIMLHVSEITWWSQRPLWFMIWSGAFERHPELRFVFTENTSAWIPDTLDYLDHLYSTKMFAHIRKVIPQKPSDYWHRQCYVGTSSMSRAEVDVRHDIGLEKIMFGTDYPHLEGTWPRTREWLQATVGGIPQSEARLILGENAARLYGFDVDKLQQVAERVGPSSSELAERREIAALADTQVSRPVCGSRRHRGSA